MALVLVADEPGVRVRAGRVFPGARRHVFDRSALSPEEPFRGPLFDLLAAQPPHACLGLVVPVTHLRERGGTPAPRALLVVHDHVNLSLESPLAGRWPGAVARTFPAMTGIYQPDGVRPAGDAQVYSAGVVAGVADRERLTPFESAMVHARGYAVVCDMLVPVAIMAAYYGLKLAACGISAG